MILNPYKKEVIIIVIPKQSIERKVYFFTGRCLSANIDNASLYLFGNILENRNTSIREHIITASQDSIYAYHDAMLEQTNSELKPYINMVDTSSLTGDNYKKMIDTIRIAQEIYISKQLEANLKAIIQNALIQYVESIDISAALPCNRERIIAFIVSHIENIIADSSKSFNAYIEDLNNAISEKFLAEIIRRIDFI